MAETGTRKESQIYAGIIGLGRQGRRHAQNMLLQPNSKLIAGCTINDEDFEWAAQYLKGVPVYRDINEMFAKHKELNTIVISSSTTQHICHAKAALENNCHVLVEKPLSTSTEEIAKFIEFRKNFPDQICAVGFSRRFDPSTRRAKERCDEGILGRPLVFRGWTLDQFDPHGFFIEYASKSGGIFVDCSVHDIDLTLFFCGEDIIPKRCFAVGSSTVYPALEKAQDCDNVLGVVEFQNGLLAHYYASRTMPHGHDVAAEISGTDGKVTVNMVPALNRAIYYGKDGSNMEMEADYWDRFEIAFSKELEAFYYSVTHGTPLPLKLETSLVVSKIGCALQKSLREGRAVNFDENGNEIYP